MSLRGKQRAARGRRVKVAVFQKCIIDFELEADGEVRRWWV